MPIPANFDHHRTHIAELNEMRKSVEYERASPMRRQVIDMHALIHEQLEREQNMMQAIKAAPDPLTGMVNPIEAAIAASAQAHEPPSPDKIMAEIPNAIAPEGGVGPEAETAKPEFDPPFPQEK